MTTTQTKLPVSFWIIGIVALLWNLGGIVSFSSDVFMSPEAMEKLTDAQRELYENTPVWLKFIYGVAVFSGTLGCILLLMRKASAIRVFIVSLVTILIQMLYSLFMTNAIEVYGAVGIVMPLLVIGIAIFLIWYSNKSKANGWIA